MSEKATAYNLYVVVFFQKPRFKDKKMLESRVAQEKIVGKHVFGNLYNCPENIISDEKYLRKIVREAIKQANMTLVSLRSWSFGGEKGGVSVIALITESHVAVHTWREYNYATVDIYTCGEESNPEKAFDYIVQHLRPESVTRYFADRSSG
ncbi:S-adenosylmethionine decarboxylase [Candidatus Caldarchaeum subterraneum]|uniref:S-adenosylmethionine decarboxylase proenzyme n=1 Tax=Caldiarchaeum subterraneum TaxID=311458 RepID=E6N927_CALS0|nr:S-adenosylmethionine decarboxylase [Candidatus Caldarchaeum subterraneum]BAJ51452.1 S-adenosylmethionine decarboxylase [Candidatus Caldarchaeum subterraneum]